MALLARKVEDWKRSVRLAVNVLAKEDGPPFFYLAYPFPFSLDVEKEAKPAGIPPELIFPVMRQESVFDPLAVSPAGAVGLMQVMPETAEKTAPFSPGSLFIPSQNIHIGSTHLAGLLERYGKNLILSLAAYNAGEEAVEGWKAKLGGLPPDGFLEEIPYAETRRYVRKVVANLAIYTALSGTPEEGLLSSLLTEKPS